MTRELKRLLLANAAPCLFLIANPAQAQVQPGDARCPATQQIVECSGDLGPGVLVTPPDSFIRLILRNLTANIAPPAGRDGIRFVNTNGNITIEADAPARAINVTGDGARGIFAQTNGASLSITNNLAISTQRAAAGLDPALGSHGIYALHPSGTTIVTNSAAIAANGIGSHGIFIDASGAGADRIDLTNSGELRIDASLYTVVSGASPSSAGIDLRMSTSSTLNLNNTADIILNLLPPVSGLFPEFLFGIRALADGPNQNINITNSGDIRQTAGAAGIFVQVAGNLDDAQETVVTRLVNSGDIETGGSAVAISAGSTYFENNGILRSSLGAQAGSASAERIAGVDIRVAGFSRSFGVTGRAFPAPSDLASAALIEVVNRGTIESTGQTETSALHLVGYDITVANSGSILASGTGGVFANAMLITALGDVRISSSGTIRSRSVGGPAIAVASYNAFPGEDDLTELLISGIVEATAENTAAVSLAFFAGSLLACPTCTPPLPGGTGGAFEGRNNVTVEAGGRLLGGTGPGGAGLIFSGGRRNTLDNRGTVGSASGVGVLVGASSPTSELIINRGTIGSMMLEGGDDEVQLYAGGTVTGRIDGGAGNDVLRLRGAMGTSGALDFAVSPLAGFESFFKEEAGTWTLAGDGRAATAPWAVNGGTLLVTGNYGASAFTVGNGATLGGSGTVGTTTIASAGILAPGLSVGTLTVNGNLVLQAGSLTFIELSPARADRINVTGTATISGGLTAFSSGGAPAAGRYTILNAAGGVTGVFAPFTTQGAFPGRPTLEYDGNNVVLVLQTDTSFSSLQRDTLTINPATVTTRQVNLFNTRLLGRLNGGAPLFDQSFAVAFADPAVQAALPAARLAITNAGAPALIVFSDPVLVTRSVTTATNSASTFTLAGQRDVVRTDETIGGPGVSVTIGDRRSCTAAIAALPSSQRPACAAPPPGQSLPVPPGVVNYNTTVTTEYTVAEARTDTTTTTTNETYEINGTTVPVGTVHAAAQSGFYDLGSRFLARAGREGVPGLFAVSGAASFDGVSRLAPGGGHEVWAEGYRFRIRHDSRRGIPAERRDAWGVAGGFSLAVADGVRLGLGVDHGRLDLGIAATSEEADVELTQLGLTGRFGAGPFSVTAALAYGSGEVRSRRTAIGDAAARYDVELLGGFIEARYQIDAGGGWRVAPSAGLDWARVESDAFTESGPFGFIVPTAEQDRTRAFAGLEAGRNFGSVELTGSARYLAVLDGEERVLPVRFAAAPGAALTMRGLDEGNSLLLGAQARIRLSGRAGLYFAYEGRVASAYDAHAGAIGLRLSW